MSESKVEAQKIKKARKVERFVDDMGRTLSFVLSEKKAGRGDFYITSSLRKKGSKAEKGKRVAVETFAAGEAKLAAIVTEATAKGWLRKQSAAKYDFDGIPEPLAAAPKKAKAEKAKSATATS